MRSTWSYIENSSTDSKWLIACEVVTAQKYGRAQPNAVSPCTSWLGERGREQYGDRARGEAEAEGEEAAPANIR